MGMPLAAVALHFGANDVQGTVVREQIFHAAGAVTETEQKIEQLVRFVRDAGRIPVAARHALQRAARGGDADDPRRRVVTSRHRRATSSAIALDGRDGSSDPRCAEVCPKRGPSARASAPRDPPRPHLVRQHGAGLPPAQRRGGGGAGRPDGAERDAARRAARPRADLVDRVRAPRRVAADPAAHVRLVRGRRRLDPARLAHTVPADPLDRRHAGERDLGRAREGAAAAGDAGAARRRRPTRSC